MKPADTVSSGISPVRGEGCPFRSRITARTSRLLFTVYAPAGIDSARVRDHLQDLKENVLIAAPQAEVKLMRVYTARGGSGGIGP